MVQLSVNYKINYFTIHYLYWSIPGYCMMINVHSFGFQPRIVSCQKTLDMRLWFSDNSTKSRRPVHIINDNSFFHWMIVVRNGQAFKYSQKEFLNTSISIWVFKYWYKLQYMEKYLNTVVEVFVMIKLLSLVDQFSLFFFHCQIPKRSAEEAGIKTITSPYICCRTTLWNIRGQLYSFTFILVRITCFMSGGICFMSFYSFIYFFFLILT